MGVDWPVLESEVEYDTGWYTAGYDLVERPDGERARYYWVDQSDAVTVVPMYDGEVVLVEQYRPKFGERFVECPAGGVDEGETYVEAATRELREETGFDADSLTHLHSYYPSGSVRYERGVVFAEGLTPGDRNLDDGEFIDVRTVSVEQAMEIARTQPTTGWTLTPLLLAREEGLL